MLLIDDRSGCSWVISVSLSIRRETVVQIPVVAKSEVKSRRRDAGGCHPPSPCRRLGPTLADWTMCCWGGGRSPFCRMNGCSDSGCKVLPNECISLSPRAIQRLEGCVINCQAALITSSAVLISVGGGWVGRGWSARKQRPHSQVSKVL